MYIKLYNYIIYSSILLPLVIRRNRRFNEPKKTLFILRISVELLDHSPRITIEFFFFVQ